MVVSKGKGQGDRENRGLEVKIKGDKKRKTTIV